MSTLSDKILKVSLPSDFCVVVLLLVRQNVVRFLGRDVEKSFLREDCVASTNQQNSEEI